MGCDLCLDQIYFMVVRMLLDTGADASIIMRSEASRATATKVSPGLRPLDSVTGGGNATAIVQYQACPVGMSQPLAMNALELEPGNGGADVHVLSHSMLRNKKPNPTIQYEPQMKISANGETSGIIAEHGVYWADVAIAPTKEAAIKIAREHAKPTIKTEWTLCGCKHAESNGEPAALWAWACPQLTMLLPTKQDFEISLGLFFVVGKAPPLPSHLPRAAHSGALDGRRELTYWAMDAVLLGGRHASGHPGRHHGARRP